MSKIDSETIVERTAPAVEARRENAEARKRGAIKLTSRYTLEPVDDRNWAMCDDGEAFAWWPSFEDACRGVARRLVDRQIRASLNATTVQELVGVVEKAKQAVVDELKLLRGV